MSKRRATTTALISITTAAVGYFVGTSHTQKENASGAEPQQPGNRRISAIPETSETKPATHPDLPTAPETPAAAAQLISELLNQKQSTRRDLQFSLAALALDGNALPEVWADLQARSQFTDYSNEWQLANALLTRWAEIDPLAALDASKAMNGWQQQGAVGIVAKTWTKSDPNAALAWAKALDNPTHRHSALGEIISEIGKNDRGNAFELYIAALDDRTLGSDRWNNTNFFADWAREDPTAAVEATAKLLDKTKSDETMKQAVGAWALKDTDAALNWLNKNLSGDVQRRMLNTVYESWSVRDPIAAGDHMLSLEDHQQWQGSIDNVVRNWGQRDFKSAKDWIDKIDDPKRQAEARAALIQSASWGGSMQVAADYALQSIDNQKSEDALMTLGWNWSYRDPKAALEWFEANIQDETLINRLKFQAIQSENWENPAAAIKKLPDLPAGKQREEAYANTASNWANQNLDAARKWANDLPEGTERDLALSSVTGAWIKQDTTEATNFIDSMEPGDLRDQMTAKLASHYSGEADMDTAIETARRISDPYRKADAMETTLRTWMRRDPDAATEFINQSQDLDPQSRWRLLTPR